MRAVTHRAKPYHLALLIKKSIDDIIGTQQSGFVNVYYISAFQYLSKTFSKVTLPNIRKGLVKVTFPSPLQYLNGSLFKPLLSLKVYCAHQTVVLTASIHASNIGAIIPPDDIQ